MTSEERAQIIGLCATLVYVGFYAWVSMGPLGRRIMAARIQAEASRLAGAFSKKHPPVSHDDVLSAHERLLGVVTVGDLL